MTHISHVTARLPSYAPSLFLLRAFATSSPHSAAQKVKLKRRAERAASKSPPSPIPPYPYGISHTYKQANRGLYGNSRILFGNTVSEKNENKNRRVWRLNIHSKRLWSAALGRFVRIKVQSRVLRTIDKVGGFDEYILGNSVGRIKELGPAGWALRWRLMGTEKVKERYKEERRRLGVPEEGLIFVGREGGLVSEEVFEEQVRAFDEELDQADKIAEMEEQEDYMTDDVQEGKEQMAQDDPALLSTREEEAKEEEEKEQARDTQERLMKGEHDTPEQSEGNEPVEEAGFMEEQEKPQQPRRKGLFQRWFGR